MTATPSEDTSSDRPAAGMTAQVIIAGAGPVGLMLAAELRLGGIDVLVIERRPSGTAGESRAPGINARSMEVFAQRGLAGQFLELGKPLSSVMFSGVLMDPVSLDPDWPEALILPQHETERILAARAVKSGMRIRWSAEVTSIEQDRDGVDVQIQTPTGPERVRGSYLVGCDGGRSTVRKSAGIDFPGLRAETWWVVGDLDLADAPGTAFAYNDRIGFYQISQTELGWTRLTLMLQTPPQDPTRPVTLDEIREAMIDGLGTDYGLRGARWMSRWSDGYHHAATYRQGRTFLAGDAAHTHTPVGGQGLNVGIQDAANLGWKLAAVIRGEAPDSLLDTYHDERHPVGADVLKWSMAQTETLKPGRRREAIREVIGDLLAIPETCLKLSGDLSGLGLRYPLGDSHPLMGRRMPNLSLTREDGATDVFTLLHDGRPLLIDLGAPKVTEVLAPWADRVEHVTAQYEPDRRGDLWHVPVFGDVPAIDAVLVRPDGYVAWANPAAEPLNTRGLLSALTKWVGTAPDDSGEHAPQQETDITVTEKSSDRGTGIDGTWTVTFTTPSGESTVPMVLINDGEAVNGTYDGGPIQNGRIRGAQLTYTAQLSKPFRVKIKCTATVDGDTMTGMAKAAMMSIPFTATRPA